ncbi:S9 family peptidase [Flavisolibacter nicotianae]|uniref:S9 family peptidase n=1 Tax=Flavisolibacter nicotianae TaxID=2364882 RepID=UPI0013C49551|nr:S9 family peptidase [Flavisolibacter nicotianae]
MRRMLWAALLLPVLTYAQTKPITLEDIFKKNTFRGEQVAGFEEERTNDLFKESDIKDESGRRLTFSDFTASQDKKHVLFSTENEPIYRRSSKATVYIYDATTRKTSRLTNGKVLHASFSPDGSKVAYVLNNNLYLYDVHTAQTRAITKDGKWNFVINGNADWVYEEEFGFSQAYQWSPNGAYLAFYKFDESRVKEYNFTVFDDRYNKDYRYKYPKAGDSNSTVSIHIYDVAKGKTVSAQFPKGDIYIPRIKWTQSENKLVVFWMNRLQNNLRLLLTDAATGKASTLYEEKNKWYVDINDDWQFLKDGRHLLYGSEKNGWYRLYLQSMDGKQSVELTRQAADVTEIVGVDEKAGLVYYTVAYPTPLDRNLFVTDLEGKHTTQLTSGPGWHRVEMNAGFTQFIDRYSTLNMPETVTRFNLRKVGDIVTATEAKKLADNARLNATAAAYGFTNFQLIRVPNRYGDTLNGMLLRPSNFDASKKYPVLFYTYGGPGDQQAVNRFGAASANRNLWLRMLAQRGFFVVCIDNTGTGSRGEAFKKKTYLQLGKYEIEDQIDAAKWMRQQANVDPKNIGHWGWSFGGFMSSLAITKGADVFTAAVAVAPVTSWRYYDNIYTERFLRTPQENPKGYDENSPINFVDKIRGKYLLIHGTADDNVHFQNSTQMVTALVKANVNFETMYYPNKNHGIRGEGDNTTLHLYAKMTNWILQNLGNENVDRTPVGNSINEQKGF